MNHANHDGHDDERTAEDVLLEPTFTPNVKVYYAVVATTGFGVPLLLIGIVLAPFTLGLSIFSAVLVTGGVFALARWFAGMYFDRMSCTLTRRLLHVRKGVLVRKEQSIPLDKITDLATMQGPIQRWLDLEALRVETAGQGSGTQGGAAMIIGVRDPRGFRKAVLDQRDRVVASADSGVPLNDVSAAGDEARDSTNGPTMADVHDTLLRIEDLVRNSARSRGE
jgi:putative membrane protein